LEETSPDDESNKTISMDDVLDHCGHLGLYQWCIVLYFSSALGASGMIALAYLFNGRAPQLVCPMGGQTNGTACSADNVCSYDWSYELQNPNSYVQAFNLVCEDKTLAGYPVSAYFVGFLFGAAVGGTMADNFGRRRVFILSSVVMCVAIVLGTATPSYSLWLAYRAVVGLTVGAQTPAAYVLMMECVGSSKRGLVGGLIWTFWIVYVCLNVAIAYVLDSTASDDGFATWRLMNLVTGVPMMLALIAFPWLPESPRWLLTQGRTQEAWAIALAMCNVNTVSPPRGRLAAEAAPADSAGAQQKLSMLHVFSLQPVNGVPVVRLMLLNCVAWFSCTLGYYGLGMFIADMPGSIYVNNFISTVIELPAYLGSGPVIDRVGRKLSLVVALIGGGCACFLLIFIEKGSFATMLAFAAKFAITGAFSIVYVFTSEMFPGDVRSIAMGVSNITARMGGIVSPQIKAAGAIMAPLIFGVAAAGAGLLVMTLPETLGKPMPDRLFGDLDDEVEVDECTGVLEKTGV